MVPVCDICRSNPAIPGEACGGSEVCYQCLLRIGHMADRPWAFGELERQVFSEAHGDAVTLEHVGVLVRWRVVAGGPLA